MDPPPRQTALCLFGLLQLDPAIPGPADRSVAGEVPDMTAGRVAGEAPGRVPGTVAGTAAGMSGLLAGWVELVGKWVAHQGQYIDDIEKPYFLQLG